MRLSTPLAVFVLAILAGHSYTIAEDADTVPAEKTHTVAQEACNTCPVGHQMNGFDQYRRMPDLGSPHSPGHGYKHFALPFQNYTHWHRPKAATLTKCQRCAVDKFRPRGYGHLFARPCDSFRMEYSPDVLGAGSSPYGPSYQLRAPDNRCDNCPGH